MQIRTLCYIASILIFSLGAALFLPIFTAWFYSENLTPLIISSFSMLFIGALFSFVFKPKKEVSLSNKESIIIVASSWLIACIVGAIPFVLVADFSFTDAFFESVSGFTTTGASIITDIEILPKGLLMWRSLTHWLGGMGIIVLTLAILPMLGMGGMQLFKAEVTGPQIDKIMPKIRDTAMYLWIVYFLLTIILFFLLLIGGMSWFDSLAHTFATVATGGFSTQNASLTHYSPFIQWVVIIFMFICGINFTFHYRLLFSKKFSYFTNTEFKIYATIIVIASVWVATQLYNLSPVYDLAYSIRSAVFQVVSICTSTGFATDNYELWPFFSQAILLFVMAMGSCAGSTGGGIKVMRFSILYKFANREVLRVLHPRALTSIKLEEKSLPQDVISGVIAFVIIYIMIVFFAGLAITFFGHDFATAFSATISAFSNTGPGFGNIGPVENFAFFEAPVKYLLCIIMLIGRLEIFTILLLFLPSFWKS